MEIQDARKITPEALLRRKQAIMLFKKGMKRYEIAAIVGVTAYTVGQWIRACKKRRQGVA